jgi:hypothetical protein
VPGRLGPAQQPQLQSLASWQQGAAAAVARHLLSPDTPQATAVLQSEKKKKKKKKKRGYTVYSSGYAAMDIILREASTPDTAFSKQPQQHRTKVLQYVRGLCTSSLLCITFVCTDRRALKKHTQWAV